LDFPFRNALERQPDSKDAHQAISERLHSSPRSSP
jgi:hypothetical protein